MSGAGLDGRRARSDEKMEAGLSIFGSAVTGAVELGASAHRCPHCATVLTWAGPGIGLVCMRCEFEVIVE